MKFTQQHKDTALNIGIFVAVVIGLYFLYKWVVNHVGGHGGTLFGGKGTHRTFGNGSGMNNAGATVADKIEGAFNESIFQPAHHIIVATQLSMANKAAAKYRNKPGTDIVINKALKAALDLPDSEFLKVIKEWLAIDNLGNIYNSDLAGAKITASTRSAFLSRYSQLLGTASADVPYMAHKIAPNS